MFSPGRIQLCTFWTIYSPEENLPAQVKDYKKNIAFEQESKLLAHAQTLVK